MNVFGFVTIDAVIGLLMLFFWGVFFGSIIGLVRFILFQFGLRQKNVWRDEREVIKHG